MTYVHLHSGGNKIGVAQMEVPREGEIIALTGGELFRVASVQYALRPAQSLRQAFEEQQIDVVLDEI